MQISKVLSLFYAFIPKYWIYVYLVFFLFSEIVQCAGTYINLPIFQNYLLKHLADN